MKRLIFALLLLFDIGHALADTDGVSLKATGLRLIPQLTVPDAFTLGRVGLWYDSSAVAFKLRNANGTDTTLGAATSTGNFTFSSNAMDLSGASAMTIGATNATQITIGKTTSGTLTTYTQPDSGVVMKSPDGTKQIGVNDTGVYSTAITIGGSAVLTSVTADSPFNGAGTSASHLSCPTCLVSGGSALFADGTTAAPSIAMTSEPGMGCLRESASVFQCQSANGAGTMRLSGNNAFLASIGFASYIGVSSGSISFTNPGFTFAPAYGMQQTDATAKGTCDAGHRGALYYFAAGSGASDVLYLCAHAAANSYAWEAVFTAP